MIDASVKLSPGWWMARLFKKLEARRGDYAILDSYYRGEHAIPIAASKATRDAYRRLMQLSRTNFAELVVEAPRERMKVVGFRTGATGDAASDADAWRIWQANNLDAAQNLAHRAKLSLGDAYVIVGDPDPDVLDDVTPLITVEDPREVVTIHDPRRPSVARAGLKAFYDEELGVERAFVFLPGGRGEPGELWTAERTRADASKETPVVWGDGSGWEWEFTEPETLPIGPLPVVRFGNRLDIFGRSQGEFEPHLSILDRINYTVLSRLEIATLQAFRQRAIKGVPDKDEEGNDVNYNDVFDSDPGALWVLPETAELWESGVVDLSGIRQAVRDDVQDLAAVTRTPLFYLTAEGQNGSAEGASLAREGLVFKTSDRIVEASDPWEQVMSLAFLFAGDEDRAKRTDLEAIWAPPERFSLAERYDAATKAAAAGVPWRSIMAEVLQQSPQAIDRMETERATDLLLAPVPTGQVTP